MRTYSRGTYFVIRRLGRFVRFCTMNVQILGSENVDRPGGYLLASNHFSHVDPLLLSTLHRRPIDWMTRVEFFKWRFFAWLLRRLGSFSVNRQGVPVSAIRTAMARIGDGRIVGIFPEGGVTAGANSVCRGVPIRQGVCLISCRTGAPIVPCVILGSHALSHVGPWLPFRRAQIWMAFGRPLFPPPTTANHKAARKIMAAELQQQFTQLYEQMVHEFAIEQRDIG